MAIGRLDMGSCDKSRICGKIEYDSSMLSGFSKSRMMFRGQGESSYVYLLAAIGFTAAFCGLAIAAVCYRFLWQLSSDKDVPLAEIFATISLTAGAAVGMEYWARWAHRALWHGFLWGMHKSHHQACHGKFEANDIFAITNAIPAISLMVYGFFYKGVVAAICFGTGLGITVFGMGYMFVHDGLVHKRFPVGPVADVPYLQRLAAAHKIHHADIFKGIPFGLFLGPKELQSVGGLGELDKMVQLQAKRTGSRY